MNDLFIMDYPIKIESRNIPYFGKYKYRARCKVLGANYTYFSKTIEEFKDKMDRRKDRLKQRASWNTIPSRIESLKKDWTMMFDLIDYDQIEKFLKWRYNPKSKDKYITRIQGDHVSFFSNDLEILKPLITELDPETEFTEADVYDEPDVLYFRNEPKFKYRTYFKGKRVPNNFREDVRSFIEKYDTDNGKFTAQICPSLKQLVSTEKLHHWAWLHGSYHVDYNDESTSTLLHMFFGGMLGKTYRLMKGSKN